MFLTLLFLFLVSLSFLRVSSLSVPLLLTLTGVTCVILGWSTLVDCCCGLCPPVHSRSLQAPQLPPSPSHLPAMWLWVPSPCPRLLPPSPSHSLQAPPTCQRCGSGSRPRCSLPAPWPHFLRSPRLSPLGYQAPAAAPPSETSTHQGLVLGVTSPPHGAASACRASLHQRAHRTLTNILSFVVLWLSCAHSRSRRAAHLWQ